MSVSDWSVMKLLTTTTPFFQKKGIPSARLDAELLLAHVLKCSRVQLYTRFDQPLTDEELGQFRALVARRAAREPVAYLLGRKEFWGIDFQVGPGVLIPRPDTEILLEEALRILGSGKRRGQEKKPGVKRALVWNAEVQALAEQQRQVRTEQAGGGESASQVEEGSGGAQSSPTATGAAGTDSGGAENVPNPPVSAEAAGAEPTVAEPRVVLDLCTGSGILPICLARDAGVRAIGVDISPEALEYARRNVEQHAPPGVVALLKGDLLAPVPARFLGRFELVTSNPPYIAQDAYGTLEPEIVKYEPALALKGGLEGLEFYTRLASTVGRWLKPGGHVLFEVGDAAQGEKVLGLLQKAGFQEGELLKDLAGLVRVVRARKPLA